MEPSTSNSTSFDVEVNKVIPDIHKYVSDFPRNNSPERGHELISLTRASLLPAKYDTKLTCVVLHNLIFKPRVNYVIIVEGDEDLWSLFLNRYLRKDSSSNICYNHGEYNPGDSPEVYYYRKDPHIWVDPDLQYCNYYVIAAGVCHSYPSSTKYLRIHMTTSYESLVQGINNMDAQDCYVKRSIHVELTLGTVIPKSKGFNEVKNLNLIFKPPFTAIIVFEAHKIKWDELLKPYITASPLLVVNEVVDEERLYDIYETNLIIKEPNFEKTKYFSGAGSFVIIENNLIHNRFFRIHMTENYDKMISGIKGAENQIKYARRSIKFKF